MKRKRQTIWNWIFCHFFWKFHFIFYLISIQSHIIYHYHLLTEIAIHTHTHTSSYRCQNIFFCSSFYSLIKNKTKKNLFCFFLVEYRITNEFFFLISRLLFFLLLHVLFFFLQLMYLIFFLYHWFNCQSWAIANFFLSLLHLGTIHYYHYCRCSRCCSNYYYVFFLRLLCSFHPSLWFGAFFSLVLYFTFLYVRFSFHPVFFPAHLFNFIYVFFKSIMWFINCNFFFTYNKDENSHFSMHIHLYYSYI